MTDVSIIVPVHNTELYLYECLDSLCGQSLQNIEFICIDDGSSDGSFDILTRYAERDPRFIILRNDLPQGPGAARNLGIAHAKGEWIGFVDSDDHIAPLMYERMLTAAKTTSSDVAICMFRKFSHILGQSFGGDEHRRYLSRFAGQSFTWSNLGEDIFRLRFTSCNRLYRRSLLADHIRFPEGIFYEDMPFHFQVMMQAERMTFVPEELYFNRRGRAGATTFEQSDRLLGLNTALLLTQAILAASPQRAFLLPAFYYFAFRKSYEHFHKNRHDVMEQYYQGFHTWAARHELDGNPHMTSADQEIRDRVLGMTCAEFLVRDYWQARVQNAELKRTVRHLKKRKGEKRKGEPLWRRGAAKVYRTILPKVFRRSVRIALKSKSAPSGTKKKHAQESLAGSGAGSRSLSAPDHAWAAPTPKELGYPRLHPENAYDALDFLRADRVRELNRAVVERVRSSVKSGQRIKVGFVVNEKEKWNGDQLVQALDAAGDFEWSFAICAAQQARKQSPTERVQFYERQVTYFQKKGPVEFELFDAARNFYRPVEDVDYDIIFLQQPWGMRDFPNRLIGKSLCVYMHYGFMIMANHGMHYNIASFHSYLWKYFTQTELHRQLHLRHDSSAGDKLVVTGYPKLDVYSKKAPARSEVDVWPRRSDVDRMRIIFAPHHSLQKHSLRMATFPWSGKALAKLRNETPNADWIYKPHPSLSHSVERAKLMSRDAYEAYVDSWRTQANSTVFDTGGYFDLFRTSDALITDCGSFLAEYLPTGKPIIWMVSDETVGLNEAGAALAEGFYKVRNEAELRATFHQVVIEGHDPLAEQRQLAIAHIIPSDKKASAAVVEILRDALVPQDV